MLSLLPQFLSLHERQSILHITVRVHAQAFQLLIFSILHQAHIALVDYP